MNELPEDRYMDYHYFAVLGEDFTEPRVVTIYRIGDEYLRGDELDSLLCSVAGESVHINGSLLTDAWGHCRLGAVSVGDEVALLGGDESKLS